MAEVISAREAWLEERWLPVVGYDGFYEVSDWGRVRSVARTVPRGRGTMRLQQRILKPQSNLDGRLAVVLSKDGVAKRRTIHQLVAEAFIGPRPEGEVTRHLDDDHLHNHVSNLAYGPPPSNAQDLIRNGGNDRIMRLKCRKGHDYTTENTLWYGGVRICKICKFGQSYAWKAADPEKARAIAREATRRYRARKRAEQTELVRNHLID